MKNVYKFCLYFLLILVVGIYWPIPEFNNFENETKQINSCHQKGDVDHFNVEINPILLSRTLILKNDINNKLNLHSIEQQEDNCPTGLETSIWYIGKHSLNWNRGFPAVDTGFVIRGGEAQTSICDRNGSLLFYTDNKDIFNSQHQVMDNGNIYFPILAGGRSSTMNLILPQPGSDSLYWFFYPDQITDQTDTFAKKLRYAIIDMSQNGGLGKVILKHQILMDTSSERVEGIRHCNGKDWWIIGQNAITEQFTVWLLDKNGLSLNGKMNSGTVNNIDSRYSLLGYLKSSHSGSVIVEATGGFNGVNRVFLNAIELHRFDPATGTIYGGVPLNFNLFNERVYGAEFSSDDTKLYITGSKIWQIDLGILDTAVINQSLILISDQFRRNTGSPVLGPDGIIYITTFSINSFNLFNINKPNEKGLACDFQSQGFYLGEGSGLGAPHFAQGLQFPYRLFTHGPYEFCADTTVRYVLTDPCPHPDLQWVLPDGGVIVNQNGDTIDVYFADPGYKRVIAAYPTLCGYKSDTLKIKVNNCNCQPAFEWLQRDTSICSGSTATFKFNSNADSVFVNGNFLTSDSFEIASLTNDTCLDVKIHFAEFCDSTLSLCIYTKKQAVVQRDSIGFCPGDSLFIANVYYFSDTLLIFNYQDQSGCDSVSYLQLLTFLPTISSTEQVWICPGDSVQVGQQWYEDSIDIVQTYSDRNGCDSNHVIYIRVYPENLPNQFNHIMCRGDSVLFSGVWYKDSIQKELVNQDSNGCDSVWNLNIKLYPLSLPDTNRYEICPGDSIQLNGQWIYDTLKIESHYQNQNGCDSVHRTIVSYKSIPEEKNLQYFICQGDSIYIANAWIKEEINWTIRKQNQSSCDSVFHYQIKWYDEIHVDVLNELQIDEGDSLVLDPYYSSNVNQVNWSPSTGLSCTNCLRPKVSPPKDTKYYITVQDDNGCTAIDSILIRLIKKEKELYVPNSFRPNGDNLNDRWGPVLEEGNGMVESIKVFDRWGNLVYECSGLQIKNGLCAKWDGSLRGKKCQPGVYVYQIIWRNSSGVLQQKVGDVSLVL
ncbi:MAG: hypothetical protein JPMHGGIA_01874 [Saprospiraceae bacterium]|nr:hypothetical protein [Saprospiraceae bacterium]